MSRRLSLSHFPTHATTSHLRNSVGNCVTVIVHVCVCVCVCVCVMSVLLWNVFEREHLCSAADEAGEFLYFACIIVTVGGSDVCCLCERAVFAVVLT